MSITPYNNLTVRDLSNVQQSYVNSITEFGYFSGGNLGTIANGLWSSLPAVLNTNNGIARVDASGGLILNPGIYKINLSLFPITTQVGRSNISFNFGTRYLVNDPSSNIVNAFGGVQPIGMFTYDPSNNPYSPGIISWLSEGYDSSNNTISNFIKNPNSHELSYNYDNAGYPNGTIYGSNCTTKMSFVLDSSASIYFNVSTNSTTGVTMGNSCFTLSVISSPFTVPVKIWRWTLRDSANGLPSAAQYWYSIASSADGKNLAIVGYGGFLYTSSNYGDTWIQRSGTGINNGLPTTGTNFACVTSSGSGQYLAIAVYGGLIYTSSNYGANWITRSSAGSKNWAIISSSLDGSRLYAGGYGVKVWRSYNYGDIWGELTASPASTSSITVSESDQYYASIVEGSQLASTSINSGASWSTSVALGNPLSIAASIDGKYIVTCGNGAGKIFRSSNYGVNWDEVVIPSFPWQRITSSVNGQYLAVCAISGYIYTSSDYGVSWTQQTNGLPGTISNWQTVESSRDGSRLVAATNNGVVYTGVYS